MKEVNLKGLHTFQFYLLLKPIFGGVFTAARAFLQLQRPGPLYGCGARGLTAGSSPLAEQGHGVCGPGNRGSQALELRLRSRGPRAQLFPRMWGLSASGIKPMSPALAGRLLNTEPPGKP